MLCIATLHFGLLALGVRVLSLHYLACFSGLAPLITSFQSLWYACMLAFDAPLMLQEIGILCSMSEPFCMPLDLGHLDAI